MEIVFTIHDDSNKPQIQYINDKTSKFKNEMFFFSQDVVNPNEILDKQCDKKCKMNMHNHLNTRYMMLF